MRPAEGTVAVGGVTGLRGIQRTYPIETSPAFFQAVRPYLPMPWVVDAARQLISDGDLASVWQGCAVLAAFLAGGLALTALAVRRGRVWTLKRLHPALRL